jgi:ATP-binding cassette subfamily B (MDR/TAP) protein 1
MEPTKGSEFQSIGLTDSPKNTHSSTTIIDSSSSSSLPKKSWRRTLSKTDPSSVAEQIHPAPFWSLYKYADKWDYLFIVIGLIGAIANGVSMPVFSIIFGNVLNAIGLNIFDPGALKNEVDLQVPNFMYLGVASAVAAFLQTFFLVYSSVRQANRLRGAYLASVLSQDVGFFDTKGTSGLLLQGLNEDCSTVQAAVGEKVSMFVFMMSTAISGIAIAFTRGWDMTLVLLSLLPVLAGTGFAISVLVTRLSSAMNRAYADANSLAQQALSNVRTVYAFNGEERTVNEYDQALSAPLQVGIKQGFYGGFTTGMANLVAYCGYALAMWYGATRVADGAYTGGEVLNVLFAALIGGFALGQAVPNWQGFQEGKFSAARMYQIMNRKPVIENNSEITNSRSDDDEKRNGGNSSTLLELKTVQGVVELRGVAFRYPAHPEKAIFKNFNLVIPAGETVALVGESGSGKSTVVQLIERFYDPQKGTVLLDNIDIKKFKLRWLRSQIGLVSQEPTLFATSIRENILFGKPGANQHDVIAAAKAANAHNFISALPQGYDTFVGEKGIQMSGGQKQRIAIARAILKDPRVLLLDEATSALDSKSEKVVQEALDRLMVGRTTVVVAHRLSTVRDANSIAVVKNGGILEQGTHDVLVKLHGVYATLVQMQGSGGSGSGGGIAAAEDSDWETATEGSRATSISSKPSLPPPQQRSEINGAYDSEEEDVEALVHHLPLPVGGAVSAAVPAAVAVELIPRTSSTALDLSEGGIHTETTDFTAKKEKLRRRKLAPAAANLANQINSGSGGGEKNKKSKKELQQEEDAKEVSLKRLAQLNRPEILAAIFGFIGSVGMGMLMPVFSLAFSSLIGVFYLTAPEEVESGAQKWSLVFTGIGFFAFFACILQTYCFNFMGQKLGRRVRVLMMQALLRQDVGWFDDDKNNSGVITSKLASDAMAVKGQFGDTMGLITQNLVTLIAGYAIAGVYSWRMMLVVTAVMPVLIAAVVIQSKLIISFLSGERETYATANATASEAFASIRTVAAFGMEGQVARLYAQQLEEPTRSSKGRIISSGLGFGFFQLVIFGIFSLAFWFAGEEVSSGRSSFVDVLKAFFSIFLAAFSFSQAQMHFPDVAKGQAASRRVFAIIDRKPKIDASDPGGLLPPSCDGKLQLKNITFAYPARPSSIIFNSFSLVVASGTTVGLVGESGSGKSTVVQLIERFYDPQQGAVLLDNIDIRNLNLHWLRSQIGLVSQEPVLFNMTVADNIRYGRPDATLEAVVAAAKAANAHTFISALPEGYDTKVGEGALHLSGGQKQRVAIARAVVKDPRVLLLDEATSALDAESEKVVQEALDRLMVGRTTVVVAHRLSTVRDANSIAVVYKGKLVEQGTHNELLALKDGAYARLVRHQMLKAM